MFGDTEICSNVYDDDMFAVSRRAPPAGREARGGAGRLRCQGDPLVVLTAMTRLGRDSDTANAVLAVRTTNRATCWWWFSRLCGSHGYLTRWWFSRL